MHIRLLLVELLKRLKLNKLAHKIYYSYIHGFNPAGKELPDAVERCFKKAVELGVGSSGDYYEFGLFKGYTFWHAQATAKKHMLNHMRFFGFDSFAGLPEIHGTDKTKKEFFYEGQYSHPKEKVVSDLTAKGVDWNKTFLIEGFFNETLNEETKKKYKMNKISVGLIDCDLYSSTVDVLNFIQDMIMDKTILIFDDWNAFKKDNERGQRKAFREFLEMNKQFSAEEFFAYGLYGRVFILRQSQYPA